MVFASAEAIKGMLVPVCVGSFPIGFISVIYSCIADSFVFLKKLIRAT